MSGHGGGGAGGSEAKHGLGILLKRDVFGSIGQSLNLESRPARPTFFDAWPKPLISSLIGNHGGNSKDQVRRSR